MFTILGQWHCVKRTLPECGGYKLETYLPVFLWREKCKKEGKSLFWEFVQILSKHRGSIIGNPEDSDSVSLYNMGLCLSLHLLGLVGMKFKMLCVLRMKMKKWRNMLNVSSAVKSLRKEASKIMKENAKKSNLNVITW